MELTGKGNDILDKAEDVILWGFGKLLEVPDKLTNEVSTPVRFCSFSPNRECRKMAGKRVQPLNNYTCRFRPSSLKQADKSGLDGLQAGK